MSFIAECTFCQTKVRVPSRAAGLSVPCPRCGNSFTLAADNRPAPAPPGMIQGKSKSHKKAAAPLAAMVGPPTPAVLAPKESFPKGDAPVSEEYVRQALQTNPLSPALTPGPDEIEGQRAPARSRTIHYLGLASFFLGSMAIVLAKLPVLAELALPLSCAGLMAGIAGLLVLVQGNAHKTGRVFSAAGAVMVLALLVIVAFKPDLLDIDPRQTTATVPPDPNKQVVLQAGKSQPFRKAKASEWVDAGEASFQHGVVRVRVTSVAIKPVEFKNRKEEDDSLEKRLVIGLRLINAQGTSPITYESWSTAGQQPRLQDQLGKSYRPAPLPPGRKVEGQLRKALLLPGKPLTDILVFEAPAASAEFLRLELPAAAFERGGTLRLQIPGSMIEER